MRLAAGDWTAELQPEAGGAITTLRRRGADILRPTAAGANDPFAFAHFALVPYANRIADGRFAFAGEPVTLAPNHPRQTHPLHGVGWLVPWRVAASGPAAATLVHDHDGDDRWPWRYAAVQAIALDADGLSVTLTVTNHDARPMPIGLGFHPYFARAGVRSLAFAADGVWLADAAMLPITLAPADALGDWSQGTGLERADLVDHCYTGWNGTVRIARDDGDIALRATGAGLLHLYVPPGEDHFCAEPVTVMPDVVNRGAAEVLAPGATRTIAMTISDFSAAW